MIKTLSKLGRSRKNFLNLMISIRGFPGCSVVKNLPAKQETWVQSTGQEDPSEEEMATHSSISTWKTPWKEKPGRLQSIVSQRAGHDRAHRYQRLIANILPSDERLNVSTLRSGARLKGPLSPLKQWRNLADTTLTQVIRINITSDKSYWCHVPLKWQDERGMSMPLWYSL